MIIYAKPEDFDWIYPLYSKNTQYLGPPIPAAIRQSLADNNVLTNDERTGFCIFHIAKTKGHISVSTICVDEKSRRQHLGKQFIDFLKENYTYSIRSVCISNTSSERFWASVSEKIGTKYSRKGTELSIYEINRDKFVKEKLF